MPASRQWSPALFREPARSAAPPRTCRLAVHQGASRSGRRPVDIPGKNVLCKAKDLHRPCFPQWW